ncbi:hypothetical protein F4778DRAFT_354639 [Xylariomycetidae sp. FL2044]|nr:hypothetical protein F4778DRAFT_354639 [Xylariomycetidae sp. FL2044]
MTDIMELVPQKEGIKKYYSDYAHRCTTIGTDSNDRNVYIHSLPLTSFGHDFINEEFREKQERPFALALPEQRLEVYIVVSFNSPGLLCLSPGTTDLALAQERYYEDNQPWNKKEFTCIKLDDAYKYWPYLNPEHDDHQPFLDHLAGFRKMLDANWTKEVIDHAMHRGWTVDAETLNQADKGCSDADMRKRFRLDPAQEIEEKKKKHLPTVEFHFEPEAMRELPLMTPRVAKLHPVSPSLESVFAEALNRAFGLDTDVDSGYEEEDEDG